MRRRRARRVRLALTFGAVVTAVLAVAAPGYSANTGAVNGGPVSERPARAPAATQAFWSSFETGDPQPAWTNTVETDAAGNKKASGVDGSFTTGIPGSIRDKVAEATASGEFTEAGEVAANLHDGDPNSKWLVFTPTAWAQFRLTEPVAVVHYALTSANDAPERDPRNWELQGSADGQTWTTLDTQTEQMFTARFQTKEYRFASTTAYAYYRLDIKANVMGDIIQLAELELSNGDTTPPPPGDMNSRIGAGPSGSPTAKPRVGYTGRNALEVSGRQLVDGRGFSYNKVFDVDIRVTRETELSYLIFPEMLPDDLKYRSMHIAVDLAFSDGTYLSDLGATDLHGALVTPTGQASSRTVWPMQWNNKRAVIGAVAAGKTIKRILVGFDNPTGQGLFRSWIDDIRIGTPGPAPRPGSPVDWVETRRGTQSTGGYSRGNNFPATAVPHGFNFWTPMTNAGSTSWLYEYHRMNNAQNRPMLQALALSHETSPWMGDRQTFQVMPSAASGVPDATRMGRSLPFGHENETAKPHYYGVTFDNGIRAEIAPTDHAALFRFTFTGASSNLIFDNVNNGSALTIDAANRVITGWSDVRSGLSTGATRMFVYATVDRPITASGMLPDGNRPATGYAQFDTSGDGPKVVTMRIASSLLSIEQARHNLELELAAGDTVESVRDRAKRLWERKLKVVEVEGATADQLTTLYSNLYRLFLYPNSAYENTGTAARPVYKHAVQSSTMTPPSPPTQTGAPVADGKVYVNNGFWDTYRTTWPAYTLFTPRMAGELIDGFVQQYKDGGWIARWSSPGYANLMVGTSSDVAFADAYLKGVRNFDVGAAYDAAVRNASVMPPNQNIGRKGFERSPFLGYTPMESTAEAMSWAMDGYINDFGLANMAKALGRQVDYEYYLNRAQNYIHMFDPRVKFFQGRDAAGNWRMAPDAYDPRVWGGDYTETNAWNMAFHVPHDGQGLANLYGGRDGLANKLDEFFATPETAMFPGSYGGTIHEMVEARDVRMGQYGHSNQPAHHIIYMYNYAGQPWKAQAKARDALDRLYLGSEIGQGYPGDEDNGEMSAWQVFSALGFYPLQMGSPYYAIGSPLFTKATVNLENGKKIVVNAPDNSRSNVYVQGLKVNGKSYNKTYLPHSVLAGGARLDFTMGSAPSRWGTGADAAPLSLTQGGALPRPLTDQARLGGSGSGVATGSGGTDVAPLFDNTSATRTSFDSPTPWVQYQAGPGGREKVTHYTLTSGPTLGQPRSLMGRVTEVSATAENPPNEVAARVADGNPNTKWLAMVPTGTVTFTFAEPVKSVHYTLTSANDAPTRDPRDWMLEGSADGQTWTTLDTQTGQMFTDRFQSKAYAFAGTTAYKYFRLVITANNGAPILQLAEVALSDGVTTGDPKSWVLKGSYDGTTWAVIDERAGEEFRWRLQTRPFKVSKPGRFTFYRLEVTANTGDPSTALAEIELLATPGPACTQTVTGQHAGPLAVASGVTCLAPGSTVGGAVTVRPGASLYAVDATIRGPVAAGGAAAVVLLNTTVTGPVFIAGTTGELGIENSKITGPVALIGNGGTADAPSLVSFDRIDGPLACAANRPAPVNNGLPNTVTGPRAGQCAGL